MPKPPRPAAMEVLMHNLLILVGLPLLILCLLCTLCILYLAPGSRLLLYFEMPENRGHATGPLGQALPTSFGRPKTMSR